MEVHNNPAVEKLEDKMRFFQQNSKMRKVFKKRILIFLRVVLLTVPICFLNNTIKVAAKEPFFSYERFFISESAAAEDKDQGLIQRDLNSFITNFNEGLYDLSGGKYSEAEKSFQKARRLWPEYYATDFLLAQVYENLDEYRIAARYYKSYLKKLKKLRSGEYRLTGPLMVGLNAYGVEKYDEAYDKVKNRTYSYGIDIDKIVPAFDPPEPLYYFLVNGGVLFLLILLYYKLLPVWKKRRKIKRVPEGFWACLNCGAYNPYLRKECEECGRVRPGNRKRNKG